MKIITMADLKKDLKKYTSIAKQEDVVITKNGKPFVKLVSASLDKQKLVDELAGTVHSHFYPAVT